MAGRAAVALLGAGRDFEVTGRGAVAETLTVRVPEWAAILQIDVTMPPFQWNTLTGLAATEFDSSGQQVAQQSLTYSSGRQRLAIPANLRRRALAIELFPAFARPEGPHQWRATVRFRFLLAREQTAGDAKDVSVVPGRARQGRNAGAAGADTPRGLHAVRRSARASSEGARSDGRPSRPDRRGADGRRAGACGSLPPRDFGGIGSKPRIAR